MSKQRRLHWHNLYMWSWLDQLFKLLWCCDNDATAFTVSQDVQIHCHATMWLWCINTCIHYCFKFTSKILIKFASTLLLFGCGFPSFPLFVCYSQLPPRQKCCTWFALSPFFFPFFFTPLKLAVCFIWLLKSSISMVK